MHVDAPKFSPFSGEDPKPMNEASFEEWKYEVNCTRENGDLSESMIAQLIRKSLRNPAKKILLPLGTSASVQTMMDKLEGVFMPITDFLSSYTQTLQHQVLELCCTRLKME